ncbi:uncharacterized protein PITG_20120 [Phytophthora infestans T30-4]|uniref:Uncharacterized protein n=1 Tax=Phytophthora infestans (strain T30-4) TaxID=403677 RepID=D0P1Y3_PHYIT|nr:uncharacterized protein PITG_20120 [Phytophthora infestans T30-4]EEY55121.1 hypothetical protein PITG_20120 [Phytophthora infestans T30-4]|eukprot:XP_002895694.1 hypothetical protein PITG_20120 [Phytophthora infestans T30-4]
MGIAFLLDPNTDTKLFINGDEANSIKETCDYAERSKMLERLQLTWTQFNGYLYDFSSEKKRWTRETKAQYAGVNLRH